MAALLEARRESPGVASQEWGASQDAELLARLARRGAAGVMFRRGYQGEPAEALTLLRERCQADGGLLGALFLHVAREGTQRFQSDLPAILAGLRPQTTVDSRADPDGVHRRVYLALQREAGSIPSAGLVLFARLSGVPLEQVRYEPDGVRVGARFIPCERDEEGYLVQVLWPVMQQARASEGPTADIWNYPISVRRLLQKRDHRLFQKAKGKVVFVGDALNQAVDERRTPFGKMLRFQIQAALLNTLLSNWTLQSVPWGRGLLLQLALFALLTSWLVRQDRLAARLATTSAFAALYALIVCALFYAGFLLPVAGPLLGLLTVLGVVTLAQASRALGALERYGGAAARLAAVRMVHSTFEPFERVATIMFTNLPEHLKDLERLNAPELLPRRKEYSEAVIAIIKRHGGRILDFQADFIMTGFNVEATTEESDHALRAVRAALDLEREVGGLKDRWLEALNADSLKAYCGICTGLVAIGWVGAKEKQSPAAIGDTTNVAARLLGAAKKMGVDILISEPTLECGEGKIVADPLPPVSLKGKTHPVPIYHAKGLTE